MPRTEARIPTAIWDDESFLALDTGSKLLHHFLLTQRELDPGGMLPLRERRWAHVLRMPVARVQTAVADLDSAGWACADDTWQELFVSGMFEFDRIHVQPHRIHVAWAAITLARSSRVAAFASAELHELISTSTPIPRGLRALVLERDGHRCRRCSWAPGDPVPLKPGTDRPVFRVLEIDHIWPRARGGGDELGNLQVLCTTCNRRKGARV